MLGLTADYFILVLAICMGVVQIGAAKGGLRGLLIVPTTAISYSIGFALPAGALAWFILVGDVGIPGDLGGVEGAEQFLLFWAAAVSATLVTAGIASMTQLRRPQQPNPEIGIEGLRTATVLELARARFRKRRVREIDA